MGEVVLGCPFKGQFAGIDIAGLFWVGLTSC